MTRVVAILCVLVAGCDEKPTAPAPAGAVSVLIDRETAELQQLEAAHRAERKRVGELDPARAVRLVEGLTAEAGVLSRAKKTLVTAREIAPAEAQDRVAKVMAEAKALRAENEALWVALQVEVARQAGTR